MNGHARCGARRRSGGRAAALALVVLAAWLAVVASRAASAQDSAPAPAKPVAVRPDGKELPAPLAAVAAEVVPLVEKETGTQLEGKLPLRIDPSEVPAERIADRAAAVAFVAHVAALAADDARYRTSEKAASIEGEEAKLAFRAVVEGHALHVARTICGKDGSDGFAAYVGSLETVTESEDLDEAALLAERREIAQRTAIRRAGKRFMRAIAEKGGPEAVERAFTDPPTELLVVEDPGWYLDPAARPELSYDLDHGLSRIAVVSGGFYRGQRITATPEQLRTALAPLPEEEAKRVFANLVANRTAILTPRAPGRGSAIVGSLYRFSSPVDAIRHLATAEHVARIRNEKERKPAGESPKLEEVAYEPVQGSLGTGVFAAKLLRSSDDKEIRVRTLLVTRGCLVLEITDSRKDDSSPDREAMQEWASAVLDAARIETRKQ